MSTTAVPTARRRHAFAVLVALVTAVLAGCAAALAALPAAAAPNVPTFTVSPADPSQTDAVTLTVTVSGCAGEQPWNVYYVVDSQPYRQADRENARFNDGVLTDGGDTWTASVTLPSGSFEAGAYGAYAYGVGPCFGVTDRFVNSNTVQFSVSQIDTTLSAVGPMAAVAGDTIQVDVAVNPAGATGPVTITENSRTWGSGTVSQGTARVDVGPLTGGSHDLVVTFGGDRNHGGSTSAPIHVEVARAPSPLNVVATPSASVRFQDVRVDVTAPASADGTFEVSEGGVVLSSGNALLDGAGSTVLDDLVTGPHLLLVTYSGSTEHQPSTALAHVDVDRAAVPLTVTARPSSVLRRDWFDIAVEAPAGTSGTFTISANGVVLSEDNTLRGGSGIAGLGDLPAGVHELVVSYSGSSDYEPSTATTTVTVDLRPTTTSMSANRNGSQLTLVAEVLPDADWHTWPEGSVQFTDGDVVLGKVELSTGAAELVVRSAAVGPHRLQVHYLGDDTTGPSHSAVVTAVVPGIMVPATATAGGALRVQATGFAAHSDVAVLLDGERIGTLVADADGAVDAEVTLPTTASGRLVLTLQGEDAHAGLVLLEQEVVVAAAFAPPVVAPPVAAPLVTTPPVTTPLASPVVTPLGTPARGRSTTTSAAPSLAITGPTEPLALVLAGALLLLVGATLVARTRAGRPDHSPPGR